MDRKYRRKKEKKTLIQKIIFSFYIILLLVFGAAIAFGVSFYYSYNQKELDKTDLGINEDFISNTVTAKVKEPELDKNNKDKEEEKVETLDISGVKNIALFGLDRRTADEESTRSDSMMVLTLNYDTKEIKLTSFMRDMLVRVDGHGVTKLNHAYAYGGPQLAVKTLNQNFGLNIEEYVSVDFLMLEEIINSVGGVKLDVDKEEMKLINKYMKEIAKKNNKDYEKLTTFGKVELNGQQAVAYARIRKHGNGDYERTERQREVLTEIINNISKVNPTRVPSLASAILSNTETSVPRSEAMLLAKDYLLEGFSSPQSSRIPRDGSFTAGIQPSGMWGMKVDFDKEKQYLREWIFE